MSLTEVEDWKHRPTTTRQMDRLVYIVDTDRRQLGQLKRCCIPQVIFRQYKERCSLPFQLPKLAQAKISSTI